MDAGRDPRRRRRQPLLTRASALALLSAALLAVAPAHADVLRLRSGRGLKGTVTRELPDALEVELSYGTVRLDRSLVQWVVPGTDAEIAAQRRAAGHFEKAAGLMAAHRFAEAAERYRAALALVPDDPNLLNNLGSALANLGDLDRASAAYERALEAAPDHRVARLNLSQLRLETGDPAAARAHLERLRASSPEDPDLRFRLGVASYKEGDYNRCAETYEELVRDAPGADAYVNLGACRAAAGDLARAAEAFREALRLEPGHTKAAAYLERMGELSAGT